MKNQSPLEKAAVTPGKGSKDNEVSCNGPAHPMPPDNGRVYLINTKGLRISSTKTWARTLDQLRDQIKAGCGADGALEDHFC